MCATCHDEVRKPADHDVMALLISSGVVAEPWNIPAEILEEHDGPTLNYDDVLDFALWLKRVDLLAAAAAAEGPGPKHRASNPEETSH
jgi:hypothetical protein